MAEPIALITRDRIIHHLVSVLEPFAAVVAMWPEGADGRDAVDPDSDLDAVITVDDGTEHQVFVIVESALAVRLRLEHAPLTSGYGMVHVSAHLPREIVTKLEELNRVTSTDELGRKLLEASEWFDELTRRGVPSHFAGPPS